MCWEDFYISIHSSSLTRQKSDLKADLNSLVLLWRSLFESDGSERQTGGLTGGLGDVGLHVLAQACLSAISVPKS